MTYFRENHCFFEKRVSKYGRMTVGSTVADKLSCKCIQNSLELMEERIRLRKADLSACALFILLLSDYGVQCKMYEYNTYFLH
jgi:hypothetical protein